MLPLHQRLTLYYDHNDAYILVPEAAGAQSLTIYRNSGDIALNRPNAPIPTTAYRSPEPIYGILGTISLSLSEYVILLTGRELRGRLMGREIYRASDFELLAVNPNISAEHPPHQVEAHLLALVRSHLQHSSFLFSYELDLTRRLQVQWKTQEMDKDKALCELVDDRFFWNSFLQSKLMDLMSEDPKQNLSPYILPIMYGTFDTRLESINGRHFKLCLISRRSRYRAGTRYFRRGIDQEGHVANFVETEQLLLVDDPKTNDLHSSDDFSIKMSFVQVRGSVPVFWAEVNTLRYKPDLQVMDIEETPEAMRKHLHELISLYGEQVFVNLLNQKGYEKPVKDAFERYIAQLNLPGIRYEHFDFHSECKHMRWDRISLLLDKLEDNLTEQGYFQYDATQNIPAKEQQGVVRTNCMDNLDRTNVMQAALAKLTLNKQLQSLGIIPQNASIDDHETLSQDFRDIWADHGDLIAKAYGGSGALKSDFTRLSKRTKKGVLEDGFKGLLRYLKNNHFDGTRQDGFDLVTGAWIPRKGPSASMFLLADNRTLLVRSVPYVTSFSLFMICAGMTLPRTSDYGLFYYFMFWFILCSISLIFIFIHGIEYVSWPRLIPLTNIIYYAGPGYRSAHHGKGIGGTQRRAKTLTVSQAGRRRAASRLEEIEMGTKKRVD